MRQPQVCVDMMPRNLPGDPRRRGAAVLDRLWGNPKARTRPRPGQPTAVTIAFADGSAQLQGRVEKVAREWMKYAYVDLRFGALPLLANIRISFKHDKTSWSLVGQDALLQPKDLPTMNFGWLKDGTDEETLRRVVLHEFGHALGCVHEHMQPAANIPWNIKKVVAHYKKQGWSEEDVKHNVLDRYTSAQVVHTGFDRDSIMLYPVDPALTDGRFKAGWNSKLSPMDRAFIAQCYPWPKAA